MRYNLRHRKAGHLFQGRYKAVLVDPEEEGYFATVSDYIHLNPARARLMGEKEVLIDFRWSSLPWYVGRASERPRWLEVSRVLGELGFEDRAKDRRAYGQRMEERAREGMEEETLGQLRRGWLFGGDAFRDRVSDWMEKRAGVEVGRTIRRAEADSDHGHRQAERIIGEMRSALEMSEPEILAARKGDWRKRVIAQRVRQETCVSELTLAGGAIGNGERRPRQPSQPQFRRFGGACGLAELSRSTSKNN